MEQVNQIDAAEVTAQTAALNTEIEGAVAADFNQNDTVAVQAEGTQERLGFDEEWITTREGNNKKWRDPAKAKRIKKIAAASRRRNRRK